MKHLKQLKHLVFPRFKDGSKPKAKIFLYGFFGHNLGDDIFFDMLLKRYPDTLFYVLFGDDYAEFFSKYDNVRYFSYSRPAVDKINRFGAKIGSDMLFEEILLKVSDAAVHIGGSVYQQIGDWEYDLKIRNIRHRRAKRFFGISNNFGPYKTESYKEFWEKSFKKFSAVTFRDKYSYNLFSKLDNIYLAPDLLFGLEPPCVEAAEKSVAISVINPRMEFRKIENSVCDGYMNALVGLTENLAKSGYTVNLVGFCNLENDTGAIEEIYSRTSEDLKKAIKMFPYTGDFSDTVKVIASSEYILATRFHASILGFAFSKKVLPVCYNIKVKNMLADIKGTEFIDIEDLGGLSAKELTDKLLSREVIDIGDFAKQSHKQFAALDKFIASRKGRINGKQ